MAHTHVELEYIKSTPCLNINLGIDDYMITNKLLDHIQSVILNQNLAKVIILHGSAEAFCLGLDTQKIIQPNITADQIKTYLLNFKHSMSLISHSNIPVVAKIDGNILGGGLGIACAADIVIMSNVVEISLPETIMGIIPAMIFPYVSRRLGIAKAKALAVGMRPLRALEALHLGLVDEVVDDTTIALNKCIKRLECVDQSAVASFKRLYNKFYGVIDEDYYAEAIEVFVRLSSSLNTKQKIKNFLEGGTPWL